MKKIYMLFVFLLFAGAQLAMAQTHRVRGRVLDENGLGFPGAGITIKNTQQGIVTDIDGNFVLDIPDGMNILTVQAIGYATLDVTVTGATVTVRMSPVSKQLQGTVVTALAVKREKRELGYSSSTVGNEELTAGNSVSAISALQGKVAGANITSSTSGPGGSTRIVLRGEKSISGNNNALIIIDGVIINNYDRTASNINNNTFNALSQIDFGNSANDIDPDDIESVTVLPGAAAAALYGSIGANGAVMISTKSGKLRTSPKKMEVSYKATYTMSDILKYPDFQHQFGQGNIYAGVADDRRENFSWGLPFDGHLRPWGQVINGQQLVKPYSDQPDNVKSFFNTGQNMNNYVSITGGTEKSSYFLSLNSINSTGVVPNTFYDKYSVRFNGSTELNNNFYSSINVNYINTYSRVEAGGQYAGSVFDNLFQTARDIPIWELRDYNNPKKPFYSMGLVDSTGISRYGYYGAYYKNPYWVNDNYDNRNQTDRILGDFTLGYRKGKINIVNRSGIDVASDRSYYKSPKYNFQPYDPFYTGDNYVSQGGYTETNINALQFNNDIMATYTADLSKDISMNLLAGNNVRLIENRSLQGTIDPATNGLIVPGFYNFDNAQGPISVSNSITQQRSVGAYGKLDLNYRKEIFLEATGRNDWTSTLATGLNSYFYPSVSGSWVFTERMRGKVKEKILTFGKIRANYASVGHDAFAYANNPPGYIKSTVASGFGSIVFPFNGVPGFQLGNTLADTALKPERTSSYEIGADLSFFKDRFSISATYYSSITVDQITQIEVPASSGYSFSTVNLGNVSNKGVELTFRLVPIVTRDFKWEVFGSYTHNESNVVSLANGLSRITLNGLQGMDITAAVGRPYGAFYAIDLQTDGKGHVVVDSVSGLPLSTSKAVYKGTFQPDYIASLGTDLSWKGFRLHVLFTTKQGGVFYSRDKTNLDFNGTSAETIYNNRLPYVFPNSVVQTGPNTFATNTTKFSPYQYYTVTEQNVPGTGIVDASYVKLQEVALYYRIPQKLYKRSPFGSLEVGAFGNNLFIWTAKGNQFSDPEQTSSGATNNGQGFNFTARPSLRNYGVSLKVTF